MGVLIGTADGIYRVDTVPFADHEPDRVLECGRVRSLRRFEHDSRVYAATEAGLFRSSDGGTTWSNLAVPTDGGGVRSVLATAGDRVYAGTDEPVLYRSLDDGDSWTEMTGFLDLPSRADWTSPVDPDRARLRALESPPGAPAHVIAGIEVGGIHTSTDAGETWRDRRASAPDDIHQVIALSSQVLFVAAGYFDIALEGVGQGHALGLGGVHRTTDGGETWTRLDVGNEHAYVRALHVHDGRLYFCGARAPPPAWRASGVDAALFESPNLGRTIERVSYPGEPGGLIEAWTVADGALFAGANRYGPDRSEGAPAGSVLRRDAAGSYEAVGRLPGRITSLTAR